MADQFIGEIRAFGFNYAPYEWAFCNGQLIPVQQNAALFAILGANYGGNGSTNFGLPNLQGRAIMGQVNGDINNPQGDAQVTITTATMPSHSHTLYGDVAHASSDQPANHLPARLLDANNNAFIAAVPPPALTTLSPATIGTVGNSLPHDNSQPYQVLNFCISLAGAWPQRP
ncbi:phage tail protein [Solimicrobium silvestre]|uniref:Microcystin-dependent protein n=1 Tax=Solimicrobium silvestre TaxID=2099400 RepID=A0A2S9H4W7_9BURK|nr:tail fiber protein [Solimicrobium silvestre]PRC95007.1 Microcystin-dependent protein [Solimicrobium silvestre]